MCAVVVREGLSRERPLVVGQFASRPVSNFKVLRNIPSLAQDQRVVYSHFSSAIITPSWFTHLSSTIPADTSFVPDDSLRISVISSMASWKACRPQTRLPWQRPATTSPRL